MKIFQAVRKLINSKVPLLILLVTAASARVAAAFLQLNQGIVGYHWLLLTKWNDFYGFFEGTFVALNHGLLPYLNFGYWYPPLFLYLLYAFYLLGGIHVASVPIVVADIATAPIVYLLVSTTSSKRVAFIAGLLYALSPIALFIEGYLWLSSQPMTFFLVLSLYLLRKDRPLFSSITLAVSILFKQEAIFILPVYAFWLFSKYKASLWRAIVIIAGIGLAASVPFLIISPINYFDDLTYGSLGVLPRTPLLVGPHVSSSVGSVIATATQLCQPILPTLHTGQTIATCGITYVFGSPALEYVAVTRLVWAAQLAVFPVFVLCAIALFLSRKRSNILELSSALSIIGFLLLFSIRVHSLLVYYFIPVYALLFASARGKSTIVILAITSALSVLTPDNSYAPALLTLIAITAIIATRDTPNQSISSAPVARDPVTQPA